MNGCTVHTHTSSRLSSSSGSIHNMHTHKINTNNVMASSARKWLWLTGWTLFATLLIGTMREKVCDRGILGPDWHYQLSYFAHISIEKRQRTAYTTMPHYKHNVSLCALIFLWQHRRQQWRLNFSFAEYNVRNKSVSVRPSLGGSRLNRSSEENYVQKMREVNQNPPFDERTPTHACIAFSEEYIYAWHAIGNGADDKTTLSENFAYFLHTTIKWQFKWGCKSHCHILMEILLFQKEKKSCHFNR